MWYPWNTTGFDRDLASFSDLFRQLDRTLRAPAPVSREAEPTTSLFETQDGYEFRIDLPGVKDTDLTLDVHDQTLTVAARREVKAREGFATHRAERGAFEWKRSYTFPTRLDAEKTAARFEHGVLSVRIAKAPEHQARRVTIAVA